VVESGVSDLIEMASHNPEQFPPDITKEIIQEISGPSKSIAIEFRFSIQPAKYKF
jgi:hypothetical protein